MNRKTLILLSSHMDREWYLPMDAMRVFFARIFDIVLDELAEDPGFAFQADGQTSALTDYLAVRPDRAEAVRKYVREGRLEIGPWYVQSDECMPAGESHTRNMLLGMKQARAFGEPLMAGYLPDTFGHISQMPQILRGFGIDCAFAMRGTSGGREFVWRGADGSEVATVSYGYGSGAVLDPDGMRDGMRMFDTREELEKKLAEARACPNAVAPHDILTLGGDMMAPSKRMRELGVDHFDTYKTLFDETKKHIALYGVQTGELRASEDIPYLQDTLAARIYLKTANAHAQSSLIRFAEPFAALAFPNNDTVNGLLLEAWRLLIENHTHDGICGCSCDETCLEMEERYRKCESLCKQVFAFAADEWTKRTDTRFVGALPGLTVFQPQGFDTDAVVPFQLRIEEKIAPAHLRAFDITGREVPVAVTKRRRAGTIGSDRRSLQRFTQDVVFEGYLLATALPAVGMRTYRFEGSDAEPVYEGVTASDSGAENAFLRVCVAPDGALTVLDKRTGESFAGLNRLTECQNVGDAYHFQQAGAEESPDAVWKKRLLWVNGAAAMLETSASWEGVAAVSTILIVRDDPKLYITTRLDNKARNHRVRAVFPTGVSDGDTVRDQPYSVETRRETNSGGAFPTSSFVRRGHIALLHRGLHASEIDKDGAIRQTLLQSQGKLYMGFFPTNENDEYDGCQVCRAVTLEYALAFLAGGEDVPGMAAAYADGTRTYQTGAHEGELPAEISLARVAGASLAAIKRAEDGRGIVLRAVNLSREGATCALSLRGGTKYAKTRLDETGGEAVDPDRVALRGAEIATIRIDTEENQ